MTNRKRLRLDVEELDVEVFATSEPEVERGTVRGYQALFTAYDWCTKDNANSCSGGPHVCDCAEGPPE